MALKLYSPTSPGKRQQVSVDYSGLTKEGPERKLLRPLKSKGGRNNVGRMTIRHQGGGHKRQYRLIDFKRDKTGIPGKIVSLEYDPNRTSFIALLNYKDGEKRYIIAPQRIQVGDEVVSDKSAEIKPGNTLPLSAIPVGSIVHNIELKPGKGGQVARSAGTYAQVMGKEGKYAQLKLPSGEMRLFLSECTATMGMVSNPDHGNEKLGKAGRNRWKGVRPSVRGVAMNPVDHPHGGGEGRTSGGRHPVTPWGVPTKGKKTREAKKGSSRLIMRRRGNK